MTWGSYDLVAEVFCRDRKHLADLITEQIHLISGVRSIETLVIARNEKLTYRQATPLAR